MMWIYKLLDILVTFTEMFALCLFTHCLLKKPKFHNKLFALLPSVVLFAWVYLSTWYTDIGAYKQLIVLILAVFAIQCLYRDSILVAIITVELWFTCSQVLTEGLLFSITNLMWDNQLTVVIDGITMIRWQVYILSIVLRILTMALIYRFIKKITYEIQISDFVILTCFFLFGFASIFFTTYSMLNLYLFDRIPFYAVVALLGVVFTIIFLYSKQTVYLKELKREDELKIKQMQQQFGYYQDKLRDEERVRALYHDMKNHLLILERQNSAETKQMVEEMRQQISDYEDYNHTGNEFLDIILKDKAAKAREKQIDFSASVDFSDIDFIEPLDISTLFGNGLDNAVEASEKLPEEQRTILVKAGKVQSFVSILIENNCIQEGEQEKGRTTKADGFLHGFGISNMKKAAEKYGGTCTTAQKNDRFMLKILIPLQ